MSSGIEMSLPQLPIGVRYVGFDDLFQHDESSADMHGDGTAEDGAGQAEMAGTERRAGVNRPASRLAIVPGLVVAI